MCKRCNTNFVATGSFEGSGWFTTNQFVKASEPVSVEISETDSVKKEDLYEV